jgi:hypothetical protein
MAWKGTSCGQAYHALYFNLQKPSRAAHSSQSFILKIASGNQIDFNFPSRWPILLMTIWCSSQPLFLISFRYIFLIYKNSYWLITLLRLVVVPLFCPGALIYLNKWVAVPLFCPGARKNIYWTQRVVVPLFCPGAREYLSKWVVVPLFCPGARMYKLIKWVDVPFFCPGERIY